MIAYNPLWLHHLFIRQQARDAFHQNSLDKEELDHINLKYPVYFYSPNFFIRIGLFILTTVIILFSFGLLLLLFLNAIDKAVGGLAIFFALIIYVALEFLIQTKNHFRSGVDDAMLWISACSLFGGISFLSNAGDLLNCIFIFLIALYSSLRFADRLMSVVSYISFLGIFFFAAIQLGPAAKALVPFVLMAVSVIIYIGAKRGSRFEINQLYSNCLKAVSISALISFYLAGNYFVVREVSNKMFALNLSQNQPIRMDWLFWCFTISIPFLYIFRGIQKKDIVLIRVGLLLVAAIVFTIRYYYSIFPIEVIMLAGGTLLISVSYALTRFLKIPRYGYVNLGLNSAEEKEKLQIESILLAQTFANKPASVDGTHFGGGNFGGGGASGEF